MLKVRCDYHRRDRDRLLSSDFSGKPAKRIPSSHILSRSARTGILSSGSTGTSRAESPVSIIMAIHIEATKANSQADQGAIAGVPATAADGPSMFMPGMFIFIGV